jgi:hypothetical protein
MHKERAKAQIVSFSEILQFLFDHNLDSQG